MSSRGMRDLKKVYRAKVETKYDNGETRIEYFGVYQTAGAASNAILRESGWHSPSIENTTATVQVAEVEWKDYDG